MALLVKMACDAIVAQSVFPSVSEKPSYSKDGSLQFLQNVDYCL
jgi:hypothetical protein